MCGEEKSHSVINFYGNIMMAKIIRNENGWIPALIIPDKKVGGLTLNPKQSKIFCGKNNHIAFSHKIYLNAIMVTLQ